MEFILKLDMLTQIWLIYIFKKIMMRIVFVIKINRLKFSKRLNKENFLIHMNNLLSIIFICTNMRSA